MQLPIIHLNGSGRETLCSGYETAVSALDAAINAVAATAPNGRDYYPVDGAIEVAVAEHQHRLVCLYAVMHELEQLAVACMPR